MDRKRKPLILLMLSLCLNLFSTGQMDSPSEISRLPNEIEPFSFTDSRGVSRVFQEYPRKVVSLGPNMTETIFALDRGDLLIGRTDFCDFPEEVSLIPSVGNLIEPNMETIVNLDPDLIIASTHVSLEVLEKLESFGIPTVMIYGEENFDGMKSVISGCATLLNAEEEGTALLQDISTRLEAVGQRVSQMRYHPSCYYALGFGDGGDWTAGGSTFINELLSLAGGKNIAADQSGWSYSKELLVSKQPEIIILNRGLKKEFLSLPVYDGLKASLNDRVFEIDENILVRQGPRQITALEELTLIMESALDQP
ncbi:ABC transporter substrate-binding protein [Oceanispirochaeta crateris]|uniref:ABC transporter substrate-binding protein n=1 Tax=Oceanispirochaeta crateris TaxID=2518645 RepID=A0A5C1QLA9_9SPIO|nr:ABC transporter substrate-binding protein [Oceanispirochaeta crateris]QEN07999.1 ABC transporter substrate-binding protein [Oceanispirochaeta crateris]